SVFEQGFITYSNTAKAEMVGVSNDTLDKYGAVSRQTAGEMAGGCAKRSGADVGVSVTGVAGPGTEEGKPVGLVYIGCCYNGSTVVKECHFTGDRQKIRENAADYALDLVRRCLE
ncbi:MAG: CinA family protein, partial [Lachnospiraceae bacterium]